MYTTVIEHHTSHDMSAAPVTSSPAVWDKGHTVLYSVQHQLIMVSIFIIIISDDHNEEKGRVWRLLMTSVMVIQQVFLV